ncbi:AAA family ATPase [Aureibacillus halotolerans]|uniref:Cellulose biosynthesis protein BcsQ n=1 Tax=Aureibacillus halotolerans TaxID=1508390 RepID=A0A4R6UAV8_9BACI|nr:AAA family ATPase [Aureibacillus halotolerans]TDQ42193.1 cellulose biosynthesis protein BcsQ [Aureibacillus halotolerans]
MEVKRSLTLAIADSDQEYLQSIGQFLRSSEEYKRYQVKFFSNEERLAAYLTSRTKTDVVLSSSDIHIDDELLEKNIRYHAVLSDQPDENTIFKYQPLPQMFRKLVNQYYARNRPIAGAMTGEGKTQVLTVASASGGTGKSTLAVLLASTMASQQYDVLYLSLEEFHLTKMFFQSDEDIDSSPVFYYAKAKPELLDESFENYVVTDDATGVHFFQLADQGSDIRELTAKDTEVFIDAILASEQFDFVIIDGDGSLQDRMVGAFKKSHYILQVLTNDIRSYEKTKQFLEEVQVLTEDPGIDRKIGFIINKFLGEDIDAFEPYGIDIQARFPYVPEWKLVTEAEQLYNSALFMDQVRELFKLMTTVRSNDKVASG